MLQENHIPKSYYFASMASTQTQYEKQLANVGSHKETFILLFHQLAGSMFHL